MNKKRILLGILVVMVMAVCSTFLGKEPSVFADELNQSESLTTEAGTFFGQGFYTVGEQATLTAIMNVGYEFDAWVSVDNDGNELKTLHNSEEYTFVVGSNMNIKAKYHKIVYTVSIDNILILNSSEMSYYVNNSQILETWESIERDQVAICTETANGYTKGNIYSFMISENNGEITYSWENKTDDLVVKNQIENSALKDFNYTITNKNDANTSGLYYYNDPIEIIVEPKADIYIYDLTEIDISLNGVSVSEIRKTINPMHLTCEIVNNASVPTIQPDASATGFNKFALTWNMQQNINASINYELMHKFEIKTFANSSVSILEVIEFITAVNYYSNLGYDSGLDSYTYLVRQSQGITINIGEGDQVYQFTISQFENELEKAEYSQTFNLIRDCEFKVAYIKREHTFSFASYVKNDYGNYDLLATSLYNIAELKVTAGETVWLTYDNDTQIITVDETAETPEDRLEYSFLGGYGYRFIGFAVNNIIFADNIDGVDTSYILNDRKPGDVEIQIVFELITYQLEVKLVDNYFADSVSYGYTYNTQNLVLGSQITLWAETNKYQIVGWSNIAEPTIDSDYIYKAEGNASQSSYTMSAFRPNSNTENEKYIIYLDVDYKYLSVTYSLKDDNIVKNVEYDVVSIDDSNKKIIFTNSETGTYVEQSYLDENISVQDNVTTIATDGEFGLIVITETADGKVLTYGDVNVNSNLKVDVDGVEVYSFDKYTYFADIKASVVDYIKISHVDTNISFELHGTTYSYRVGGITTGVIQAVDTTMTFNTTMNAYIIDYKYEMYLYMDSSDSTQYSYIQLRNVQYYYDGEKFVLRNATVNTPEVVDCEINKNDTYSLTLTNLLPNSLVVYSTNSTNDSLYGFKSYLDKYNSNIWSFSDDNGYRTCILNPETQPKVTVEYVKLAQDVYLRINNLSAYSYDQIEFTVNGVAGSGETISALNGNSIVITLSQNSISKGYKFDNYSFNGIVVSTDYTFTFTMSSTYINQFIDIKFSEIEYMLNIYYLDNEGALINNEALINGGLYLLDSEALLQSTIVTIQNVYTFIAVADSGYYVGEAYIGTRAYLISSLVGNNNSAELRSSWTLNNNTEDKIFEQAIVDNADSSNIVNLYIHFAIHTYSVKVYFEIGENASLIKYPKLEMNGTTGELNQAQENVGGIKATKYFVLCDGFKHNSTVTLRLSSFMLGVSIDCWKDKSLQKITTDSRYEIANNMQCKVLNINENVVLTVQLQYISYMVEFVSQGVDGINNPEYGTGSSQKSTFKLFDTVEFDVLVSNGYILTDIYYYKNRLGEKQTGVTTGFTFNPANFVIDGGSKFKLYLVFDVKKISLSMKNVLHGNSSDIFGVDVSEWLQYNVDRKRESNVTTLTDETGYEFQTGDTLVMSIIPISMGINLYGVKLADIDISLSSSTPYSLTMYDIVEDEQLKGMGYRLEISFNSDLITKLNEKVVLQHILEIKTYNIEYTYNFISYKFGVRLAVTNKTAGSMSSKNPDTPYTETVMFGTNMVFTCAKDTLENVITQKFKITSFVIAGIEYDVESTSYELLGLETWEGIALNRYNAKNSTVQVVLKLVPKITLQNHDQGSGEAMGEYRYTDTYDGTAQGLISSGASSENLDIIVEEEFTVTIKYDGSDTKPKDVGQYVVEIYAQIGKGAEAIHVRFESLVRYIIIPAKVSLELKTYNSTNPLAKIYDGSTSVNRENLVKDMKIVGLFGSDKIYIDQNQLTATYSDLLVNKDSDLYNINVFNICLLDSGNKTPTNYILANGSNIVFERVGKINQRPLRILGFKVSNKVYDGTKDVKVDLTNIIYQNKLETDSTQILTENLKFYIDNVSVGYGREVKLDWSGALVGADSLNYSVTYETVYIDVHPYELIQEIEGYGTVKVVDIDKKCLIPIYSQILAKAYVNGSSEYRELYTRVERDMTQNEKLKICYEVILRVGVVEQLVPQGLYVYLPKTNKISKIFQAVDNENLAEIDYVTHGDFTIVKVETGDALFSVITNTTYLPLWLIILIVILVLIGITIIVFIFVAVRRRTKQKYSVNDRI